jgi:hypothetical protein
MYWTQVDRSYVFFCLRLLKISGRRVGECLLGTLTGLDRTRKKATPRKLLGLSGQCGRTRPSARVEMGFALAVVQKQGVGNVDGAKALEVKRGYSWTPAAAIGFASRTACAGCFGMSFVSGLEGPRGICCDVSPFHHDRGLDRSPKANRQRCDSVRMNNGGVVEILKARLPSRYQAA